MTRPVLAVLGPARAGVTSVADALRAALPEVDVVEGGCGPAIHPEIHPDVHPHVHVDVDAVVFACSSVSPLADSDRALLEAARGRRVLGVLTKVDAHRTWRDVLAANRAATANRVADWVAVAAAPDLGGTPDLGDLVERVRALLAAGRPTPAPHGGGARVAMQRSRLRLLQWVRMHCADAVNRWRADAARVSRGRVAAFEAAVRAEADALLAEVGAAVDLEIGGGAEGSEVGADAALDAPAARIPAPMYASRRTESQLALVLGAGFGLGVALAAGRLMSVALAGPTAIGVAVGVLAGVAVTAWMVAVRGLLHTRAVLDRWVVEVGAAVRSQAEAVVATRLLAVGASPLPGRPMSAEIPTAG